MDFAVIVPWWDHTELLEFWGRNLERLSASEVIFVDNGSQPEGARALALFAAAHEHVTLIRNEENRGFSAANNQAMAAARSSSLLFMNSDVELRAAPPLEQWFAIAGNGLAGPAPKARNELGMPYAEGWALCAARPAMDKVQGWSEDYGPGYWDDVDLCTKAWINGIPVSHLPDVDRYLNHRERTTGGDGRLDLPRVHERNLISFAARTGALLRSQPETKRCPHPLGLIGIQRALRLAQVFLERARPDVAQVLFEYVAAISPGRPNASHAVDHADKGMSSAQLPDDCRPPRIHSEPQFGINLIGYLSGGVGLGVTVREIAKLLHHRKIPFSICDVPHPWGIPLPSPEFAEHLVTRPEALRHPVNLYVLPAATLETVLRENPALLAAGRMHVANIWWEASRFPPHWTNMLARFDGILALSDFIADICRNSLPMTPTLLGEHPLDLPDDVLADRAGFGLPDDAVVFVASLDPNSDPARKNPAALITAFRAAFPVSDRGVRLVIRLNNAATALGQSVARRLLKIAENETRISLMLEPMRYDRILSLYASADIYLSFHRGEGLGLGMLESQSLGKAVIATGWSGNLSFMDHSNSALLRYRLIPVAGNLRCFRPEVIGPDARWADPVQDDAVAWMSYLRHNPGAREALAAKAKASAREYQRKASEARWIEELMDLWRAQRHLPRVIEKLSYAAGQASRTVP